MPIKNWGMFIESGEFKWLVENGDAGTDRQSIDAWHNLQDQYLYRFGLGPEYEKVIKLKHEIFMIYAEYLATGNKDLEMEGDIALSEYRNMSQEMVEYDFYKEKAKVDKGMGFSVNIETTPVAQYFSYLNNL